MAIEKTEHTDSSVRGKLLTVEERVDCEMIPAGDSWYSPRAQALLALDEGATRKEAGEQTGLTLGQISYWLRRFRADRMAAFPEFEPAQPDEPVLQPIELDTDQTSVQSDDAELQLIEGGPDTIPPSETESDRESVLADKKTKKGKKGKLAKKNKKVAKKKSTKKSKKSNKKKRTKKSVKPKKKNKKKKSKKETKSKKSKKQKKAKK